MTGSTERKHEDELNFVKILELIERMESQLESSRRRKENVKNCVDEKRFEICRIMAANSNNSGIANSTDEQLNETLNEAR